MLSWQQPGYPGTPQHLRQAMPEKECDPEYWRTGDCRGLPKRLELPTSADKDLRQAWESSLEKL